MDTKFYWGAATAAYQCEGAIAEDNKGASIWDNFTAQSLHIFANESGAIADDAYHKVKEDVAHIKQLGLNAYRFSIAWSRIYPQGYGEINMAGIDHYNMLIDELRRAKIEPFVTLYHWDLPQGLEDKYGGWLSPEIEADFANFANTSFHFFGDRVKKWVTINEPWTIAYMGYGTGAHAPGRCSNRNICPFGNSSTESYIVGHNLLNAHAAAAELYRAYYQPTQQGEIGIVLNLDWGQPLRKRFEDLCAAVRHNEFQLGWFADPIFFGRYPDRMLEVIGRNSTGGRLPEFTAAQQDRLIGSVDFLGLNHYSTRYYRAKLASDAVLPDTAASKAGDLGTGWAHDQRTVSAKYDYHGVLIGPQAESEWLNTVPWGFFDVLVYVHNRYSIAYRAYRNYRDTSSSADASIGSSSSSANGVNSEITGVRGLTTRQAREGTDHVDNSYRGLGSSYSSAERGGAVRAVEQALSASRRLRSGDCEVMCNCDPPSQFAPKLEAAPPSHRNLLEEALSAQSAEHTAQSAAPASDTTVGAAAVETPTETIAETTSVQSATAAAVTADHHHRHKQREPPALGQRPLSVEAIPIYVTENGCDAPGESDMPLQQALRDDFRYCLLCILFLMFLVFAAR